MHASTMRRALLGLACLSAGLAAAPVRAAPVCVAPAEPGGGFDITCTVIREALAAAQPSAPSLEVVFMPGGIGAVAFNSFATLRRAEPDTLVAFSSGSILNLVEGKFGRHGVGDVRWLASIGTDYGAVVVKQDSPWRTLADMIAAIRAHPSDVRLGAGGTIGSQDWMKAALTARAAGVDHRAIRFVAFEGGGDCATALQGGHVDACMSDVADSQDAIGRGVPLRLLAVYAPERLPGELAAVPTAREEGYDIVWPILRGVYLGGDVSDADYRRWAEAIERAAADPGFEALLAARHIVAAPATGEALAAKIGEEAERYAALARSFNLPVP